MYLHFQNKIIDSTKEFSGNTSKWVYEWESERKEDIAKSLGDFRRISLFVGANNSGKSRFMRGLLKSNESHLQISRKRENLIGKEKSINQKYKTAIKNIHSTEQGKLTSFFNSIKKNDPYFELPDNYENYQHIFPKAKHEIEEAQEYLERGNSQFSQKKQAENKIIFLESILDLQKEILFVRVNSANRKIYIPVLRSIHVNQHLQDNVFKETIKMNYGIEENVFTGLELYKQVFDLKNSPGENRKKVREFEKFISKHFFNNSEIEITTDTKTKQILFSINGNEHPIYDLGDGIQSLIILLFPIFTAYENDWFFIEEPELNLHPGLQRIFIEVLLNDEYLKSKNLRYFFTTHSNHFLDISIPSNDISIFQFKSIDTDKFHIKTNVKPNKDILDILGVNTSSVFLANTSIWVEGPTDRKYISKLLKLYCDYNNYQPLMEDIDFAFFEYGGNLIEHYLFDEEIEANENEIREKINSFALSNKIFLLADNDDADKRSSKGKRRLALEKISSEQGNFTYQNTILREIENLLPRKIIKDFMCNLVTGKKNLEKVKNIEFSRNDYKKIGLGQFFKELFNEVKIPKKYFKSFKANSGTLMNDYKIKLVNFVINNEYEYSDFIEENEELKDIIVTLYNFIKK